MKKVLFIGGGMFVGRVFNILASQTGEYELHVVNRGHYPLNIEGVTEYKCNRSAGRMMARILPDNMVFDACIDTCAYSPGDIATILNALGSRIRQYIFISSADVYAPDVRKPKTEDSPLREADKTGSYRHFGQIKILLEQELEQYCENNELNCTIFRPADIYGPYNYLPRESWYIEMIAHKHTVPVPIDATANFNNVYVNDAARALMRVIGDELAYGEKFNLAAPERITYMRLMSDFERLNGGSFDTRELTVDEIRRENISFPFSLTEDNLTDGSKFAKTFGFQYTPFANGMETTFKMFYSLFT